jgi:hypothetical protein
MTKTPLEEFLESLITTGRLTVLEADPAILTDRVALVKAVWMAAKENAPAGAWDGKDGVILKIDDPMDPDGVIEYQKITYGDKPVIEAEGIVVWHINT